MNVVTLTGRLTKDPELAYTPTNNKAVCKFTLAVDREKDKTDFIRITVWDKTAEICDRYIKKGSQVAITGKITTGSYKNRDGVTVYTTDVVADRVEFLGKSDNSGVPKHETEEIPQEYGFNEVDDDMPF